ncbi:Denticleless protein-like [Stylophora pistillata]|uniref:Denticleless protein-like n=1 Tax=Stylophora pistillata TaxID=50429 RepID=A0A2B4SLI3_STYPI|nr:Denticleless protein-like [Stylophora pistillata]
MTLLASIFQRQLAPSSLKRGEYENDELVIDVPPFACRFSHAGRGGHMLGIADEEGWVQILDSRRKSPKSLIKEWNAHENAVFDIAWMHWEEFMVTASGDQTVRLWDVNRDDCLAVFKGHTCSVKSVDFREDDIFVFASGARDGNVMVWDMRCNRRSGHFCQPVNIISNAHAEKLPGTPQPQKKKSRRSASSRPVTNSGQQSVTAVLFQGGEKLISAGAMDGSIKIWDLRKTYTNLKADPVPFHTFPYPGQGVRRKHGFSSLVLDSNHSCLFASCTDDNIYMYSCTALGQEPVCTFSGHLNSTFYVKAALSPDDLYLLSGSSNNEAFIWKVSDPTAPPTLLRGHFGEVTSVAWCPSDQGKVITCSDDNSFRIWRMDCRAHNSDKHDVIGESCRGTGIGSHFLINEISSPSSSYRTPSHSPNNSPDSKRLLWTPPPKVITNPRLNQISSPVGKVSPTPKLQNPLNTTSPKTQILPMQTLPPKLSASLQNLTRGPSPQVVPIKVSNSQIGPSSAFQPSPCSSPKSPTVSKFHSPTQLLTSWLKSNSRKRSHSYSCDQINHQIKSVTAQKGSDLTQKAADSSQDVTQPNKTSKTNRQEYKTKDETENAHFSGQRNASVSPLRKRLCISDPLSSNAGHNGKRILKQSSSSPGKENKTINNSSPGVATFAKLEPDNKCHQKSEAAAKHKINAKAHSENWLMQWSSHHKEKYGEKSNRLPEEGGENTTENIDIITMASDGESPANGLQPQGEDKSKPGKSILTYFRPVSHS